jgi:hypothetical protein
LFVAGSLLWGTRCPPDAGRFTGSAVVARGFVVGFPAAGFELLLPQPNTASSAASARKCIAEQGRIWRKNRALDRFETTPR